MSNFVERIKVQPSRPRAIDVVYDELDDALLNRRFDDASSLLLELANSDLGLPYLLSGLTVSIPWSEFVVEARGALIEKARSTSGSRADELLRGLE